MILSEPPRENLKMVRTGSEEFWPGMLCINLVYPKDVWDYGEIDGKCSGAALRVLEIFFENLAFFQGIFFKFSISPHGMKM